MRSKFLVGACAAMAAVILIGTLTHRVHASVGPIPLNCNRACLEGVVDQYLAAVVAHNPKLLPLSADVLRIELGRITEIESVLYKPGGGGPNAIAEMDKPYKPEEFWFKSIPPAQRMSRPELIAIADAYFSGLQKNDGKGVNGTGTYPFTSDCHRVGNGAPTTNVPATGQPADGVGASSMDCLAQFKLGYYFVVQSIHHRRYPVVDQERGIVWAHAVFDQGTVNSGTLSDGRPFTFGRGLFTRPSSILVTEAFLIENGKIRRVEMIGPGVNYHMNSAWPGSLSGN